MIDAKQAEKEGFFPKTVNTKECSDTGMAMVLLSLLVGWFTHNKDYFAASIFLLVLNMVWPRAYTYVAKVWLGFSNILGALMSKVILSIVFFVILTPLAFIQRLLGHDPMKTRQWKQGDGTVFETRDHTYTAQEIEHPY